MQFKSTGLQATCIANSPLHPQFVGSVWSSQAPSHIRHFFQILGGTWNLQTSVQLVVSLAQQEAVWSEVLKVKF